MTKSFKIITLGCKVNQYESAYLKNALMQAGWRLVGSGNRADVAIINTCIVTQKAGHQSRQAIRKAVRENPGGLVAAVGCYAQVFSDELSNIEGLGVIADNRAKGKLPEMLLNMGESFQKASLLEDFEPGMPFEFLPIRRFPDRSRAYLKIQDGCDAFCSYCIVPLARGPCRSLALSEVLSMVGSLAEEGYSEVVLTGIHLGKYGLDLGGEVNINGLLRAIGRRGFPTRIRLSSLEPNEIEPGLVEMAAGEKWLCRHFHIPLQSGDDVILKRMNRKYRARDFAKLIESIHKKIPLAGIGVDVMAGFPGEDRAAHENTRSLIDDLPVSYLHVFPFSPRPETPAGGLNGQNDPQVIKRRAQELRDLGQNKREVFYRRCLNNEFQVLPEGWYSEEEKIARGTSDNYLSVLFPSHSPIENRLTDVRVEKVRRDGVIGSMVNE
jgi:threonylcarbamoyladenosine tRNA methylthiotransferase MtaB